ncbi:MAG: hypothetical protein AAGU19_07935 [Prolixibacteraceae bacterium]
MKNITIINPSLRNPIRIETKKELAGDAIVEAVQFCKDFSLPCCELFFEGFTFDITPDLTTGQMHHKVLEYKSWKNIKHLKS